MILPCYITKLSELPLWKKGIIDSHPHPRFPTAASSFPRSEGVVKSEIRFTHPSTQNLLSGFNLFCDVGLYFALGVLGAGGGKPSSQQVASTTNVRLAP